MQKIGLFFLLIGLVVVSSCNHHFNNPQASLVKLLNESQTSGATGFEVLSPHGKKYTLTNKHVCVDGATFAQVGERSVPLRVVEIDKDSDLCLLEGIAGLPALEIASDEPKAFSPVTILGYGMLFDLTRSSGEWVGNIQDKILDVINPNYCTATILPGNSGSPVFNDRLKVVGVCYASGNTIANRALLVPLLDIQRFLEPY